jgi:hypothetical protein
MNPLTITLPQRSSTDKRSFLTGAITCFVRLMAIACAAGMIRGPLCSAETRVGGILLGENLWDAANGPYLVESDILVSKFARLTILPGTTVVIDTGKGKDTTIAQIDALDSNSIAIKIEGSLVCVGDRNKRIGFAPADTTDQKLGWYGIVFSKVIGKLNELAYCDIANAYCGVTVCECKPLIRTSVFERNNIGVNCLNNGSALVFNCIFDGNVMAGIRVQKAAPHIANSIIINNRSNGLWCDNNSPVVVEYNCVSGNGDGNFLDCDPLLGRAAKINKRKDSVDYKGNLVCDPVFAGSSADSTRSPKKSRYVLSRNSPCINAGNPDSRFNDTDGSRNDLGIFGGPAFMDRGKE